MRYYKSYVPCSTNLQIHIKNGLNLTTGNTDYLNSRGQPNIFICNDESRNEIRMTLYNERYMEVQMKHDRDFDRTDLFNFLSCY